MDLNLFSYRGSEVDAFYPKYLSLKRQYGVNNVDNKVWSDGEDMRQNGAAHGAVLR